MLWNNLRSKLFEVKENQLSNNPVNPAIRQLTDCESWFRQKESSKFKACPPVAGSMYNIMRNDLSF